MMMWHARRALVVLALLLASGTGTVSPSAELARPAAVASRTGFFATARRGASRRSPVALPRSISARRTATGKNTTPVMTAPMMPGTRASSPKAISTSGRPI